MNYTFYVVDNTGNEKVYNTPILSNKKYIRQLENINSGDKIYIKTGKKLNYAYDIEKIQTKD